MIQRIYERAMSRRSCQACSIVRSSIRWPRRSSHTLFSCSFSMAATEGLGRFVRQSKYWYKHFLQVFFLKHGESEHEYREGVKGQSHLVTGCIWQFLRHQSTRVKRQPAGVLASSCLRQACPAETLTIHNLLSIIAIIISVLGVKTPLLRSTNNLEENKKKRTAARKCRQNWYLQVV